MDLRYLIGSVGKVMCRSLDGTWPHCHQVALTETENFTQIQYSSFHPCFLSLYFLRQSHVTQIGLKLDVFLQGYRCAPSLTSQYFQSACRSQSSTDHRLPFIPEEKKTSENPKRFNPLSAEWLDLQCWQGCGPCIFPAVNWECSDLRYSIPSLNPRLCLFIPKEDYFQSISKRHTCQPIQKPCKTEHKRHHKYSTFVPIRLSRREIRHINSTVKTLTPTACAKWQVSVIPVFSFGNMKFCSYIKSRHSHLRLLVTQNTFLKGLRRL